MNVNLTFAFVETAELIVRLLPLLIPLAILQLTLMITSLVSLLRKPNPSRDKIGWLLLILLVNLLGPVIYFAVGSNYLETKYANMQDGEG
jgi:hypothetical protein